MGRGCLQGILKKLWSVLPFCLVVLSLGALSRGLGKANHEMPINPELIRICCPPLCLP